MSLKEWYESKGWKVVADDVMGTEAAMASSDEKQLESMIMNAQKDGVDGTWIRYEKKGWRYSGDLDLRSPGVTFFCAVVVFDNQLLD